MLYAVRVMPVMMVYCLFATPSQSTNLGPNQPVPISEGKIKVLIIDGENNHGAWPKTTVMIRDFLLRSGLFEVDIYRTAFTWQGPHNDKSIGEENRLMLIKKYPIASNRQTEMVEEPRPDPAFSPSFAEYDVIISNLGWKASPWPEATKAAFEDFVHSGGGFVVIHAANNSFGDWVAYNEMIGLGGWGDRDSSYGVYVYFDDFGHQVVDDSDGVCGSHGPQQEFMITMRDTTHPITRGIPRQWMHTKDELYDRLRGPAKNMTVLATAYSDPIDNKPSWADRPGTGRHEPMMMTITYGNGRIFHQVLGHTDYSMECVGFITTLLRGTEWAATGKVTTEIPPDFPTSQSSCSRPWKNKQ